MIDSERKVEQLPAILLVSPGPIDGYPPVQHQARLFAEAGYQVLVVTSPLGTRSTCDFECSGVSVRTVKLSSPRRSRRLVGKLAFVAAIAKARRIVSQTLVAEISYDPDGVWYSNYAPLKKHNTLRIAHLHEALIDPANRYFERSASKIMHSFDLVVVADRNRGDLLKKQLGLAEKPMVIPNYPLLCDTPTTPVDRDPSVFRVVYVGSIGFHQGFDAIVRSIPDWQQPAFLLVAGNNQTPQAIQIAALAEELGVSDRIKFVGLISLSEVVSFISSADLALTLLCPVHDQWRFAAGASNKRYQCMQAGIAQISDMNPDVPELIERQGLGLCVAPDAPEAIASAVNYYISHPDECRIAGKKAQDFYRSNYHYQIPFKQLLDWIKSAGTKSEATTGESTQAKQCES
jgi:glycosyltransferase involved in cell wall biosynthesis